MHRAMPQQQRDPDYNKLPSCRAQQPAMGLTAGSWVKILVQAVLNTMPRATTRAIMAVSQAIAVLKATAALWGCPAPTSAPTRVLAAPAHINPDELPLSVRGWYASQQQGEKQKMGRTQIAGRLVAAYLHLLQT